MPYRRGLILWWDGRQGVAGCDGMHTPLPRKPRVLALDVDEIDYAPGVRKHWVREAGTGPDGRDLTQAEQDYINAALDRMVKSGVDAIC